MGLYTRNMSSQEYINKITQLHQPGTSLYFMRKMHGQTTLKVTVYEIPAITCLTTVMAVGKYKLYLKGPQMKIYELFQVQTAHNFGKMCSKCMYFVL